MGAGGATGGGRSGGISVATDYTKEAVKNLLMGSSAFRRYRLSRPRAGAAFDGRDELLKRYAFQSLDLLTQHVGDIRGKSVLEIGAGDVLSSGFALLAAGATRYVDIDRFISDHDSEEAKQWYRGIQEAWPRHYPEHPWPDDLQADNFPEGYPDRLKVVPETIEDVRLSETFDIVCSFQVGEHVSGLQEFARATRQGLKPDGVALHKVDFGPHDVWRLYSDPIVFLRFSDSAWRRTGSNRGAPNRFRHHEFVQAFEAEGLQVEVVHSQSFPPEKIDFTKIHPRFQAMPRESLALSSAIYRLTIR